MPTPIWFDIVFFGVIGVGGLAIYFFADEFAKVAAVWDKNDVFKGSLTAVVRWLGIIVFAHSLIMILLSLLKPVLPDRIY